MNAATIDLALAAKKRAVIGITSTAFSDSKPDDFTARHPSRKNLAEVVAIDTFTSADEQVVTVPGVSQAVGVASTLTSVLIVQLLVIRVVELCAESGIDAPAGMRSMTAG